MTISQPEQVVSWKEDWKQLVESKERRIQKTKKRTKNALTIQRVNQLDAGRLDEEVISLLFTQLEEVFRFLPPRLFVSLKPELLALLKLGYFMNFTGSDSPTPGQALQNLQYRDERAFDPHHWINILYRLTRKQPIEIRETYFGTEVIPLSKRQKLAFCVLWILVPWLYNRLDESGILHHWNTFYPSRVLTFLSRVWTLGERIVRIASTLNFILFLYGGKYLSIVERIIGARLVYRDVSATRVMSFEFLNRQLVWEEFTEFLLFLWPLFSSHFVKQFFRDRFGKIMFRQGTAHEIPVDACPICRFIPPRMPHMARPCGHIYVTIA
eukprot:jgi/Galph1/2047/GphlegSOOS_G711.1